MRRYRLMLLGSAAALSSASLAHAQQIELDLKVTREAGTLGRLQNLPNTSPPVALATYVNPNSDVDPAAVALVLQGLAPPPSISTFSGTKVLAPAHPAAQYRETFRSASIADLYAQVRNGKDTAGVPVNFEIPPYQDHCTRAATPAGVFQVGACDAVNATLKMNGVAATVSALENSADVTLAIDAIGYAKTSLNSPTRNDALQQVYEDFTSVDRKPALIAALLNKPSGFTLAPGVLPTGKDLLSVSLEITRPGQAATVKTFGVDTLGEALAYGLANTKSTFTDFGLRFSGACLAGAAAGADCDGLKASVKFLGLTVNASAAAGSRDITVSIPEADYKFSSSGAVDREDAIAQFISDADENIDTEKLSQTIARALSVRDGRDPLLGNPKSMQGQMARATLDLSEPSNALGEHYGSEPPPSAWRIGGDIGRLKAGVSEGNYIDGGVQYDFRLGGGGMRAKFAAPFTVIDYNQNGGTVATGSLRASVEAPIIKGLWALEPGAAIGAFYGSRDLLNSGILYSVGVSSKLRLPGIGGGHFIVGNAVTYSSTIEVHGNGFATPKVSNTIYRNGIAYQQPVGRGDRKGSIRASYAYTFLEGDRAFLKRYHEAGLTYAAASRRGHDLVRMGVTGAVGKDYKSGAVKLSLLF